MCNEKDMAYEIDDRPISVIKEEQDREYYFTLLAKEKKQNSYHNQTGKYKKKSKLKSTWSR